MWPDLTPNKYRRIVPGGTLVLPVTLDDMVVSQGYSNGDPARYHSTPLFERWADGSCYGSVAASYTWPDMTSGHTAPKNTKTTFGNPALGTFQWNKNIFSSFACPLQFDRGQLASAGVALNRSLHIVGYIKLLDENSATLTTASWQYDETDTYPAQGTSQGPPWNYDWTKQVATSFGTEKIKTFNGVQLSMTQTGCVPASTPAGAGCFFETYVSSSFTYILGAMTSI